MEHSGEPFFPLQQSDIASYRRYVPLMRRTFEQYDIVQAYTTSGMYPLLAGFKNFTAYELGTLRTIPFQDDAMGRICAWVYRSAPAVFITNVDCIQAAERLGIDSERAHTVPHAFDCEQAVEYVKTQRPSIPVDRDPPLFLAPARHHWKTGHNSWRKGNDLIIRATRTLKDKGHRFKVIFVEWGQEIDLSKQLIEDLEVTEFFEWHRPMSKKALWPTYLRAAGVIDQFVAPAMGGVALEALGLGRPLITRLDVDACLTFFSSMPPVCNAGTTEAVAQAMEWVLSEPEEAEAQARAGQEWMQREHSTEGALAIQIAAYRGLIETSEQGGKPGDGAQSLIVG